MTSTRPWYALLRLMPPWIGLCAVTLVLLAVTLTAPIHPTIQEVHGPWKILSPVERNGSTITLPGNFASQGHPSESRLVVERAVTAPGGPLTLWIDRPMYAVRVLWDGVELGRSGDPGHEGDVFRSAASLILPVPDAPADSVHRIVLDIRGDYGDGGIDNGIRIGPSQAVQRAARSAEVRQLSTALGLCVCALIALALAAGRRRDPTHLTLGLLALMLALLTYTRSSHIVDLLPYVVETLRLERAATGPIAPLFIACIASHLYGAPRKAEEYYLVAGFTLSVIALLIPSHGLRAVALVCNAAALSGILWYGMLCIQAARRWERHNLKFLALVGVPLVLGGASELALSAEWRHGPSYLMASALWLVGGLFVGVLFRDARASARPRACWQPRAAG